MKKSIVKQSFIIMKKEKLYCNIRKEVCSNGVGAPSQTTLHVTKKQITCKDKMTSSNNNIYECKCYINLFNIVPVEMESSPQFNCVSYAKNLYTN